MTTRVVLVRPWRDARVGSSCCGGGDARHGICFDERVDISTEHDAEKDLVAQVYLRLRDELPDVDVQIVGAENTAYLVPTVFRAVHRRRGVRAALAEVNRATTAGSVLFNGERLGDVITLGAGGVVKEVRRRVAQIAG
ncbi:MULTISPECIES: hypothetical protein [Nocardioides]|uniref:Uncharacterized protein n=1 Tax=Nocardioides vastitatis TaxID=2568655 RepID=A0ABW0ZSY2_9ACTN|nr:hypothetical protein [Nocardioides sp.]THJ05726.1 hypothetical protein E7Z54_07125 [Nocardioides sp.]